jgi:hypothetical protein
MGAISERGAAPSNVEDKRPAPRRIMSLIRLSSLFLVCASVTVAQLAPIKPPPGWGQVPSGTGACSVEKSCAELAPAMIRSARGASPLEGNLRQLAHLGQRSRKGSQATEPAVEWAVEALRHAGVDRVRTEKLSISAGDAAETEAVVGEIRGREKPEDFVVLGAHLDVRTPDNSAPDDAADAAVVIDAARVIHDSGTIPRRSIRFVLFVGTKQGKLGSGAYVAAHNEELDRAIAAIFFNVGTEPVNGYSLNGRKDILAAVRGTLKPVRSLGVKEFTLKAELRPDSLAFLLEGIPTLVANPSLGNRVPDVRTYADTLDPAALGELKNHVAIAAVTAYAIADARQRIGPRQSRDEVERLIKVTGLDREMKREGLWPARAKDVRGRRP